MLRHLCLAAAAFAVIALGFAASTSSNAQGMAGGLEGPIITSAVNESQLVSLPGNPRPEANAANDRGPVADDMPMEHMQLLLRRSPEREQALEQLIDELHDPASPQFHQWLSPQEFGFDFGLAASDLQTITGWLQIHGFVINSVAPSTTIIDFSGDAGQVRDAFHTEIHNLDVNGVSHIANMSDPQIPAALAPAVVDVVSLHDFRPEPDYTFYNSTGAHFRLVPADLATIYNFNPLFSAGITGTGQTIYLIENSDLYADADWTTFRSTFGLGAYTGASLNTIHPAPPTGSNNCSDPGATSNDGEATLDAEWASAAAPNAAIVMATCANTTTTFGGLIAIENLVNGSRPPAIISQSYHECEASNGAAANAAFNSIYQQGVAEGISFFNSAGDAGAARCNGNGASGATHGIGVNAYASTPYNVAVGGTDFSDTFSGINGIYWNSSNSATYGSAKSYIPEIPWNNTCGSQLVAFYNGFSTTYGASGFCNSSAGSGYLDLWAGSGGPSGCATGSPSIPGVVSGTCQGYAKPSWQRGLIGNPNDGVRDLPDVSLFASNGPWRHSYVFCFSDASNGGLGCTGAPSNWNYGGGTSFATPIMAGLQALVNQSTGRRQGNPNYVYYAIAADEYGTSGSSACNSSHGNTVGTSCIFYDVTQGDNDVDCAGSYDCYIPSGTYGVLSTSDTSFAPAYQATAGWDFATGIGTINAYNLVMCWRQPGQHDLDASAGLETSGLFGRVQRCRQLRP